MSRVIRFLLGGLAAAAFPTAAAAQFNPVIGPPNPLYNPSVFSPYPRLWQPPAWRLAQVRSPYDFQFSLGINLPPVMFSGQRSYAFSPVGPRFSGNLFGGPSVGNPSPVGSSYFNGSFFAGMTSPSTGAPQAFYPYWGLSPGYSWSSPVTSGYISGGNIQSGVFAAAQREFERAQREASTAAMRKTPAVKDVIFDQWAYERLGVVGGAPAVKVGADQPAELAKALAGEDEESIISGDDLNHILVAILAAEAKGGKGPSAFLGPRVLDAVRFTGSPAADAVNFVRQAGKLPFPPAFDDTRLKDARDQLDNDFAAAVAPLRDGKSADAARLTKVGLTLQKLQEIATPVIRSLPFEESTASRRFLNRFEKALPLLRGAGAASLVHPAWEAAGTSVAELVKHMQKNKLLFGPAADGGTDSYLALHRALANYLFVISQPPKK